MSNFQFVDVVDIPKITNCKTYDLLIHYAKLLQIESYLEIGVRNGDSLKTIVENNLLTLKDLYISDTWGRRYGGSNKGNHQHIETLLQQLNYNGITNWLDGDSQKTLIPLIDNNITIDMIFIDGDHSQSGAEIDLNNSLKLLKKDGIICFHDIYHNGHKHLKKLFEQFCLKYNLLNKIYDIELGVGIIKK